MIKVHRGLLAECIVCNPGLKKEKEKYERHHITTTGITADIAARRQTMRDIGDAELSRDHRNTLFQKYGVYDPVIDRDITMPLWKAKLIQQKSDREVSTVWNNMMQDWFRATKGLVQPKKLQWRRRTVLRPNSTSGQGYTRPFPKWSLVSV